MVVDLEAPGAAGGKKCQGGQSQHSLPSRYPWALLVSLRRNILNEHHQPATAVCETAEQGRG